MEVCHETVDLEIVDVETVDVETVDVETVDVERVDADDRFFHGHLSETREVGDDRDHRGVRHGVRHGGRGCGQPEH